MRIISALFLLISLVVFIFTTGCSQNKKFVPPPAKKGDSDSTSDSLSGGDDTYTDSNIGSDITSDTYTDSIENPDSDSDTSNWVDTDPKPSDCVFVPSSIDIHELPGEFPSVNIQISQEAMDILDDDPFEGEDQLGTFIAGDGTQYVGIDINYRGAYALQTLMYGANTSHQRNWKVKFDNDQTYRSRREWNYNYEPHLRQKLALDLLKFNGVKVPSSRHVLLHVNGDEHGLYVEYEDPDNKDWLCDMYGHDNGDLFKAAFDIPNEPQYFGTLEILGTQDSDYLLHFNKKTNHKVAPDDYSTLRTFIEQLNNTDDAQFESWLEANFDVDGFISYLVVSNFISNWDSYPQRPKNYWIYENRREFKMVFIPWDLDATFEEGWPGTSAYNQMGTTCSVFFNLQNQDYETPHSEEGIERPLVRRMMNMSKYMDAYVENYRNAVDRILNPTFLNNRIDALTDIIHDHISEDDLDHLEGSNTQIKEYIQERYESVSAELESY